MSSSRRREPPVEGSWRIVEGEHDSFDTTILPTSTSDSSDVFPTQQSSSGFPSQQHGASISSGSQDSIRDFATHQEDEQVILREPFRPSVPPTPGSVSHRSSEPQFRMPLVAIDGASVQRRGRRMASTTARAEEDAARRRSGKPPKGSTSTRTRQTTACDAPCTRNGEVDYRDKSVREQIAALFPAALYDILFWSSSVIGLAFRYAQKPLAILLAVYLSIGSLIIAENLLTKSLSASLSPLCRIPLVPTLLHFPFCPDTGTSSTWPWGNWTSPQVEFDDLMEVQGQFERVLDKTADSVSLPYEMRKSHTSVRSLRTLVRHSQIENREELVLEFNEYIDVTRVIVNRILRLNSHVGAAADFILSTNRWTSHHIAALVSAEEPTTQPSPSMMANVASWLFYPFTPTLRAFDESLLHDRYIQLTADISSRIATLIAEAQEVLQLLTKAEDHLESIHSIASRNTKVLSKSRDQVLWSVWTYVGANHGRLAEMTHDLRLLRTVDQQRLAAVAQISALILDLETMQAGLDDLQDAVDHPRLLRDADGPAGKTPLSVHIVTIDLGVERLEAARRRLQLEDEDKARDYRLKSGVQNEPFLEGH